MSAKHKELMGLAESLVAYGHKQGATDIEVSIQEGTEFRASIQDQNLDNLTESVFKGLDLRVFAGNKMAQASSSDFAKDTLHRLVDNAVTRARLGGEDPFAGLPDREDIKARAEDLKIFDPAVLDMPPEKKIAYAKEAEAIGLKDERIKKSAGATYQSYTWSTVLANSKGFAGAYERTLLVSYVGFQCGEGDNLFQEYWVDSSTQAADLKPPEYVAKKAVHRATRLIGGRKVETQNVPLVVDPTIARELIQFIAQCVSGPSVARRQSFLTDKIGEKVGNDKVNIIDDGLLVGGRGTIPFDSEGVPCRRTPLFEKGVLKNYLLDTYWGRKLKLPSTGNRGGPRNLYWAAGTHNPEDIIKSVSNGLYMTGSIGLGTEATTGDISQGAYGLWIENGELTYPVAEITVATNLGTLLENVEMVGNDLEMRRTTSAPTIKFAEVTVGGKEKREKA
jgi:PmbA protein